MPVQFTMPPDTRVPFGGNPAGDMDAVIDALNAMGAGYSVLNAAFAGGADPTGTSACDTAVQAAANALPAAGGAVLFPPGTYKFTSGVTIAQAGVYLQALIPGTVIFSYTGSGACVRMYATNTNYTPGQVIGGGVTGGIIIDLAGAGNGASGLRIGDIFRPKLDCTTRNAATSGASSKNFWFDNNYTWCEQITGQIFSEQGPVVFDNSANTSGNATGSFSRPNLDIFVDGKGKSDLVVFQNGAYMADGGYLGIHGNTDYGSSLYYVLKLTGSNVANGYSLLRKCVLMIDVECNATVGTQPKTILFNSAANNGIFGCSGLVDFAANNPFSTATGATGSFQFDGPVYGDGLLQRSLGLGTSAFQYGTIANGNTINTRFLSKVKVTTTGNVTGIILQGFPPDEDRLVTVVNKGAFTVTFDVAATSHVADGTSDVIAANTAAMYQWDNNDSLWYRVH